ITFGPAERNYSILALDKSHGATTDNASRARAREETTGEFLMKPDDNDGVNWDAIEEAMKRGFVARQEKNAMNGAVEKKGVLEQVFRLDVAEDLRPDP